jgi:hypothetical protein
LKQPAYDCGLLPLDPDFEEYNTPFGKLSGNIQVKHQLGRNKTYIDNLKGELSLKRVGKW